MKKNLPVSQRELDYPNRYNILSTTDLKGAITYINDDFLEVSGFETEELIGKNHNVVRHPDMPPAAFKDMWQTLQAGDSWMGLVKNRCKNGDHYWVDAYATPIKIHGATSEYQSVRVKPDHEAVERAEQVYPALMAGKQPRALKQPRLSLNAKMTLGAVVGFLPLLGWGFMQQGGIGLLAAFGLSVVLTFAIGYWLSASLRRVVAEAKQAYDNPLMQYLYTGSNDDVSQVELAIKKLRAELRAVVARVNDSSEQVEKAADASMADMTATAEGARNQQDELQQVAAAIDEMSASIEDVASNVQTTAQASQDAHQAAQSGRAEVNRSFESIRSLVNEVNNATHHIEELDRHSTNIESVLDVIKSVAEQTNLLALNAAIEAARAGEAGRGFAVVADEVRTLAQRTQESTIQIEQQIESLQVGVKQSVLVMEQGKALSESAVEDMERTGVVFDQITDSMSKISDMSLQVASATEQQSAVAGEISQNINRVNELSMNNLETSSRAADASQRFLDEAKQQQGLIHQFLAK